MSGRNHPVPVTCPNCANEEAELLPPQGDRNDYRCPDCGDFSISGSQQAEDAGPQAPERHQFVEHSGRRWRVGAGHLPGGYGVGAIAYGSHDMLKTRKP